MAQSIQTNIVDVATWATVIGFVVSLASLAITAWRFVGVRRAELHQAQYKNYHDIILGLIAGGPTGPKVHEQMVAVFELRKYPQYADVSIRILVDLKPTWHALNNPDLRMLLAEMDETVAALKTRSRLFR